MNLHQTECECSYVRSNVGCSCVGLCSKRSVTRVYRTDRDDWSGVELCRGCARDAMESGVFSSEEPS